MKKSESRGKKRPAFQVNENISLEEQIAQRAHELWEERGRLHGNDFSDWLKAEAEINAWHEERAKSQA